MDVSFRAADMILFKATW